MKILFGIVITFVFLLANKVNFLAQNTNDPCLQITQEMPDNLKKPYKPWKCGGSFVGIKLGKGFRSTSQIPTYIVLPSMGIEFGRLIKQRGVLGRTRIATSGESAHFLFPEVIIFSPTIGFDILQTRRTATTLYYGPLIAMYESEYFQKATYGAEFRFFQLNNDPRKEHSYVGFGYKYFGYNLAPNWKQQFYVTWGIVSVLRH